VIFQVRGATGEAPLMDDLVDPGMDWRQGDLGQALIDYAHVPTAIDATVYEFLLEDQPLVGLVDTGFSANNPDLDYSRIQVGKDWVDGDGDPFLSGGEGNEHGTHTLGLIGAEQGNNLGIDGLNDDAPLWVGRAIGSGQWHESLREFVDAAQDSGQPNAVINLSLDLTQIDGEGNVTTRYEFTPQEREAIEYARQNGVLLVVAAGNDGEVMSVLGQAAQEFDNILTVGAAVGLTRAEYSSYGNGLGLLAPGGTEDSPVLSLAEDGLGTMAGTSVATAQVTGAVSQVWAANPQLSYRQVIEILQATATDLEAPGWDAQTGAGLLDLAAAVQMAQATEGEDYSPVPWAAPDTWSGEGVTTPMERAVDNGESIDNPIEPLSASFIEQGQLNETQPERYYKFNVGESGYFQWTRTKLNGVSDYPAVSVVDADGNPAWRDFRPEDQRGGAFIRVTAIVEGQEKPNTGGGFLDKGTYFLKVSGGSSSIRDYQISTQWSPDTTLTLDTPIRVTDAEDFREPFIGAQNRKLDTSHQLYWDFSDPDVEPIQKAWKSYGLEIKEEGRLDLDFDVDGGDIAVFLSKQVGSTSEYISVHSNSFKDTSSPERWSSELSKGRYELRILSTGEDKPVQYQVSSWFTPTSTPAAPRPGDDQIPKNAGEHIETISHSSGVITHHYENGHLVIQPSGEQVWYEQGNGGSSENSSENSAELLHSFDKQPPWLAQEPYLWKAKRSFSGGSVDFGDNIERPIKIFLRGASVGGSHQSDYYYFDLDDYKEVTLQLKNLTGKLGFSLVQDLNENGRIDDNEIIAESESVDGLATPSRTRNLAAGRYYIHVYTLEPDAPLTRYDLHYTAVPSDSDGNGSLFTSDILGGSVVLSWLGAGAWSTQTDGSFSSVDRSDYYRFSVGDNQEVSFKIENATEPITIDIIRDRNSNGLLEPGEVIDPSEWRQPMSQLTAYLEAGDYYVRLRSNGRDTDYRLNVRGIPFHKTAIDFEYQNVNAKPRGFGGEVIYLGDSLTNHIRAQQSPQGTEGFWRAYEDGGIYWSEQHGAVALWYAMDDLYRSMGGTGSWLGFPTRREYQHLNGRAINFEGGYIFWQPGRQPKAYKYSEFPNEKPRALVNSMELSTDDFFHGSIVPGLNEHLFPFNRYVGWSDPDGDAIKAVAFYDPTPDQPVNGRYLGNGTGHWAWPGNLASSISTPPAPIFKGVSGGVIGVDQLNSIYYSHGKGNTNILDEMAVAVFDGYEWSDPKAFNIRVKPGNRAPVINVWNQTINESDFARKTLSETIGPEWVTNMQGRFGWSDPEGQPIQAVAFYDSSPWNNGTGHFAVPDGTPHSVTKSAPNYRGWSKTTVNTKDLDKLYYSHHDNVGITDTVAVSVFDGDKWSQPREFNIYVEPRQKSPSGPVGSVDIGAEVIDSGTPDKIDISTVMPPIVNLTNVTAVEPERYGGISIRLSGSSNTSNMKLFLGDHELVKRSYSSPISTINQEVRPFTAIYEFPPSFPVLNGDQTYRLHGIAKHSSGGVTLFEGPGVETNGLQHIRLIPETGNRCTGERMLELQRELIHDALLELTFIWIGGSHTAEMAKEVYELVDALSDGLWRGEIEEMALDDLMGKIKGLGDIYSFSKIWKQYLDYRECREQVVGRGAA
jgi:hypothetical protein